MIAFISAKIPENHPYEISIDGRKCGEIKMGDCGLWIASFRLYFVDGDFNDHVYCVGHGKTPNTAFCQAVNQTLENHEKALSRLKQFAASTDFRVMSEAQRMKGGAS